ncbi:MAG: NAD(P)H-dependent oxidoreductase [Candidatus Woesearchaeota archaeon]
MHTVMIIAHPQTDSHVSHTRHGFVHARSLLEEKGVHCEVIDLYEDEFDPVMRRSSTKRHLAQLERYRSLIDEADRILIFYPVWWNGPPAILKGFFDSVFVDGWAYHYQPTPIPKVGRPIGHLKGKRAAVVSTTGALDVLHRLVQRSRAGTIVSYDILGFAGIRARRFNTGGCQRVSDENLRRVERTVERAVRFLGVR